MEMPLSFTAGQYVGDDLWVSVLDGGPRQYVDLDTAATSSASVAVARAVQDFLPWYASVHRGAGIRSQLTSARYEEARETMVRFVGGDPSTHLALFPRNTTEAINLLAFRLGLTKDDVVVTTAVEHHANLLPWRRHAQPAGRPRRRARHVRRRRRRGRPRPAPAAQGPGHHRWLQRHRLAARPARPSPPRPASAAS